MADASLTRRFAIPRGWAELWADGGAVHPLRTYVVQVEVPGMIRVALGTVVAPAATAALTVARGRWRLSRHPLRARPAGQTSTTGLFDALARDGAALFDGDHCHPPGR